MFRNCRMSNLLWHTFSAVTGSGFVIYPGRDQVVSHYVAWSRRRKARSLCPRILTLLSYFRFMDRSFRGLSRTKQEHQSESRLNRRPCQQKVLNNKALISHSRSKPPFSVSKIQQRYHTAMLPVLKKNRLTYLSI